MVGGKVIGLVRRKETTLVNVEDGRDTCAVRVVEKRVRDGSPVNIRVGDQIWWQCGNAMWTPQKNRHPNEEGQKCGVDFDIRIPKVGFSH